MKYDTKSRFVKIVLTSKNCKFKATHFDKGEFKYNNQPSLVFKKKLEFVETHWCACSYSDHVKL